MTAPGAGRHHRRGPGGPEAAAAALHQLHLDAALRSAEASPTARALLDQARNGTYARLAPIVAEADPYWAARQQMPPSPPMAPGPSATCGPESGAPVMDDRSRDRYVDRGPVPDGCENMRMRMPEEPSWRVEPETEPGVPTAEDAAGQSLTARVRRMVASAYRRTRRHAP